MEFWELTILHFLNDGVRTTFPTLLPFIAKDLSINLSSVGFLGSSNSLFQTILALPAGFFAAKFGQIKLLIVLLLVYSLGSLATAFSPNIFFVAAGFYLGSMGFGMFHPVSFSFIAKKSHSSNLGKKMGDFTALGDVGRIVIPPLAVLVVSLFNWRIALILIAALGFLLFIALTIYQLSHKQEILPEKRETHADFIKQSLILLKDKKLFLTFAAAMLDSFASSPVFLFLPFLIFSKGITVPQYAIVTGFFFAGSLLGKFILGRGVDKVGNIKVFSVSECLMAVCLVLLTITNQFFALLVVCLLLGVFTRGTIPVIQTIISQIAHKKHYDKIYSLSEFFIAIASTLTILIMGIVAEKAGIPSVFYLSAIFAVVTLVPVFFLSRINTAI